MPSSVTDRPGNLVSAEGVSVERVSVERVSVEGTDGESPSSSEPDLAALCRACVELADATGPDATIESQLSLLGHHVRQLVRPIDVAVILEDAGTLDVAAASGPRPKLLQHVELDGVAGPAIECHRSRRAFLNVDLDRAPTQWKRYGVFARAIGYRTLNAVPLRFGERSLGAVFLGEDEARPLTDPQVDAVLLLVASSAIAVNHLRTLISYDLTMGQLHQALRSRVVIEQAKGAVAERLHVSPGDAFALLRRFARNRGLPLRAVAGAAIDGELGAGELCPQPPPTVAARYGGPRP